MPGVVTTAGLAAVMLTGAVTLYAIPKPTVMVPDATELTVICCGPLANERNDVFLQSQNGGTIGLVLDLGRGSKLRHGFRLRFW